MPVLGLGVAELSEEETERAVYSAPLDAGYRSVDTASAYGNEEAVGRAIAASGIPRPKYVTTKLATQDQGFQSSQDACKASLERLGLDYVDLYLIHWPAGEQSTYIDSWGGLLKATGRRPHPVDRRGEL